MYKEARAAACLEMNKVIKEAAAALRKQKRDDLALRLQTKLKESPLFADLHAAVADIFAKQLLADKKAYESKKFHEITFAAKWCPSLKSSYDLRLGLCRAIATRLFSEANEDMRRSSVSCAVDKEFAFGWKNLLTTAYTYVEKWCPSFLISLITCIKHALQTRLFSRPVDEEGPAPYTLEDRLRKEFYVPLRQALKIPEIYMSAKRWHELPYEHVPSVAMTNYAHLFLEHDRERYQKFLKDVDAGRKKVAAGALLPHQILQRALRKTGQETLLAEAQWKRMVEDLKKSGSKLSSSMAVCDVSGSMMGIPMEVCIALGLLVAELSEEPFKNHICTFSNVPGLHLVQGETLAERYRFTKNMNWNLNTDFQAVFRLLLHTAREKNLPKDKMVKRLFVFSDMEFDEASANPWETDYFMITKMYEEAGYGNPPDIVFWNLRDSISTPVLSTQAGVVLVSGFSKNLLKMFLEEDAELVYQEEEKKQLDPREVMMKALTGEYFEDLKVVD